MTLLVIAYAAVTVRFGLLITRAEASVRPLDNYKLGELPRNGHQADMTVVLFDSAIYYISTNSSRPTSLVLTVILPQNAC